MKENKTLLKNTILFGIGSMGTKVLMYILVPIYTMYMDPQAYAVADLSILLVQIISVVFTCKIASALVRFTLEDKENGGNYLANSLFIVCVGTLLFAVLAESYYILGGTHRDIVRYVIPLFLLFNLFECLSEYAKAIGRSVLYMSVGVLFSFILLIANDILLKEFGGTEKNFFLAQIIAYSVAMYVVLIFLISNNDIKICAPGAAMLKQMLSYSVYLAPAAILLWIVQASDRYMVAFLIDEGEAGIYSVAYKIPGLCAAVVSVFGSAWHISAINEAENVEYHTDIFHSYAVMASMATSGIIILSDFFANILYKGAFIVAKEYVPLLLFAHLFSYFQAFLEMIMIARKMTGSILASTVLGALVNIILNFILIRRYGIFGAIWATLVCYLLIFLQRYVLLRKEEALGRLRVSEVLSMLVIMVQAVLYGMVSSTAMRYVVLIACFIACALINGREIIRIVRFLVDVIMRSRVRKETK